MRGSAQIILSIWLASAMTLAQACAGPARSSPNDGGGAARVGSASGAGKGIIPVSAVESSGAANSNAMAVDKDASRALTADLKRHRLPLVGAQVLRNPATGQRAVMLYGFVATDYGKSDAQRQAEDYVNDPAVDVENRIIVNPQLLAAGAARGANAAANSPPGVGSYSDQQNQAAQIQQYQQQQGAATSMSTLAPLIALLGILSVEMAASGPNGFAAGPGYPSPYGYSGGASPYSNYPSPAAPMTPFGYGGSPFGFGAPSSTFP